MKAVKALGVAVIGAITFWVPAYLAQFYLPSYSGPILANVLPLISSLGAYWILHRLEAGKGLAIYMLCGMYVSCPLFAMLSTIISGEWLGPPISRSDVLWLVLSSVIPPLTWLWAEAAFFGFIIINGVLIILAVKDWNRAGRETGVAT